MSNFQPNSASRPPETSRPPEDDGFRIVPPPGVSAPPPGVSMPPPQQPVMQPRPVPVPVVAPPPVVRQPPQPATRSAPNRQRLYMALGAGAILLAAIAFFIFFEVVLSRPPQPAANAQLSGVATAAAVKNWPTAIPGCAALFGSAPTPQPGSPDNKVMADTLYNCGIHLVAPAPIDARSNVELARQYFQRSNQLAPSKDAQHQIDLANRYTAALDAVIVSRGAQIDQLMKGFIQEPEFDKQSYADVVPRLYAALIDSGDGYAQGKDCGNAKLRYSQALALKGVDTTTARQKLEAITATCQ